MAIDKSQKPANLVPRSFGGEKNNFSDDLIASGFEPNMPETYNGENLNYQLDATGKELDYCEKVVDYINGLGVGKTPIVNANNKLDETQVGLKVYSATETYSLGEWVRSGDKIYQSLTQGNLGNDLTNETYWKEVELGGLPSQTGKNGKFLKTDGEQASWQDVPPATILAQNTDLLKAGDKKVQFMCSQESPVKVRFVDGTEQELTSIEDLDVSGFEANTYRIVCNKSGTSYVSNIKGNLTVSTTGVASNFNANNHIVTNYFNPSGNTWEMQFKITTGEDVSSVQQEFLGGSINGEAGVEGAVSLDSKFRYWIGTKTNSYDIASGTRGTYTVLPNTTYWVKIYFTGTEYKLDYSLDGETFVNDISTSSTSTVQADWKSIGIDGATGDGAWLGTIDLTQTYFKVGDTITWNGADILNESYPVLGTITLNSDKAITIIKSNYAVQTENTLEQVNIHTVDSYSRAIENTETSTTQMDVVEDIGDNYNPLYFANVKTISANTGYTFTQNGTFFAGSASIATITITKNGSSFTLYSTTARIPRGCSFTTSVAGEFCFDDNYYGYLAN